MQYTSPVEDFPLDKWNEMIQGMLTVPFVLTKHFLPAMKTKGKEYPIFDFGHKNQNKNPASDVRIFCYSLLL